MYKKRLFSLIAAHYLADYPLQGDFLSRAKNRKNPIVGVPWYQALIAHSTIHGFMVYLITGSLYKAFLELAVHSVVDDLKCRGKISYNQDQAIHFLVKLIWARRLVK